MLLNTKGYSKALEIYDSCDAKFQKNQNYVESREISECQELGAVYGEKQMDRQMNIIQMEI